jgi:DNA invertase Pin-like site-specific DNA recombinase
MPRAYSYVRFSSPDQRKGDSLRRQTQAAQRYCAAHGLELDTDLTLNDLGKSAFHGANLSGALGAFMEAVAAGHVEPGSVLIVESLDRLSRQDAWSALPVLQALIGAGISVVTLSPERTLSTAALVANPFLLMEALLYMIRANEESATKSRRAREAWSSKRAKVAAGVPQYLGKLPSWVRLREGRFTLDRERVKVIRRMANMVLEGKGQLAIARALNRDGVPPFGRAKQWHKASAYELLRQPSFIGTATLFTCSYVAGRMVRTPAGEALDYFPPALDVETWTRVQDVISSRAPQRGAHVGKPLNNVFAGLLRCPACEGSVRIHADRRNRYLVCSSRSQGACDFHIGMRYDTAERSFLIEADYLIKRAPRGAELDREIEAARGEWLGATEEVDLLVDAIARGGHSEALAARLRELEAWQHEAAALLRDLEARAEAGSSRIVRSRLKALRDAIAVDPLDRAAVNLALRNSVSRILAHPDRLVIEWRHGGEGDCVIWG